MEQDTSSSPDSMEDLGSLEHSGQRLYPSDELIAFNQSLGMLRASHYNVQALAVCVQAARDIVCTDSNQRQTDMDAVRRFLRDDLQTGVDRIMAMGNNSRVVAADADVMEALYQVMHLGAGMLRYRQQHAAVMPELDSDLTPLMLALLSALGNHRPLYHRVNDLPVPREFISKHDLAEQSEDVCWIRPKLTEPDLAAADEDMQEDYEETDAWFTRLANTFGDLQGFQMIIEMLLEPEQVSFDLLNTSAAVLAQVSPDATPLAKEEFIKIIGPVARHTYELIDTDSPRLSNLGSDRTYSNYNCLVNINLPRMISHCFDEREDAAPHWQQLRVIRCAFVNKMLESSSFNKLLTGARECNRMLELAISNKSRAGNAQRAELWKWLQDNNIVQRLLRTGLHHKQYMTEVEGVMQQLTKQLQLTEEHLDLMWAVTEKEDAYDAVKTHMFELLAAVAAVCQPSQLDMLFAKLERRQARSVQDAVRLLTLLATLADGDHECKMRDKIIQLAWDLTTHKDTPVELLEMRSLAKLLKSYCELNTPQGSEFAYGYARRCFTALKDGQGGQVALLRMANDILDILVMQEKPPKSLITRQKAVDDLETKHAAISHLVKTVCDRVYDLREKIEEGTEAAAAAATAAANGSSSDSDLASIKAAAMAELGEGAWSYAEIVDAYLVLLKDMATYATNYFSEALAGQLWNALMMNPPSWDHLDQALEFFRGGIEDSDDGAAYFDEKTQQMLLRFQDHLTKQDVEELPLASARLTWDMFGGVNADAKRLGRRVLKKGGTMFHAETLDGVIGLDLIWRIYLGNADANVADLFKRNLLTLYHGNNIHVTKETPHIRSALVHNLVRHLQEAGDKLSVFSVCSQDKAAHAARTVVRCLALATNAVHCVELATMPPVPAHNRAWRGSPVMLEVQREGTNRLRVQSHDNEYIGLLRERIARHMGCSAKNVRMICMGQELHSDSFTLQACGLRNRATLNAVESPEPNKYTQSPSEYREHYESHSYTWLFSQADGLYPLLLQFIDAAPGDLNIASMALQLLAVLPTNPALSDRLAAALDGPDKHQQLAGLLGSSSMAMDAGDKQCAPYQTLYGLQALCALLFPTLDEALLALADRDAAAEGSACPSPAAAAPAAPGGAQATSAGPAGSAEAPASAAEAAAVSAVQHQHHREVQQQEFLHSGGLQVVLQAAQNAAQSSTTDLQLQRQLSELLVVLLHNLLDAAQGWQSILFPAGLSNGPAAMSGAESGAGQPAGAARHAAPASSLVGATGAAAQSASMPLADPQPATDPAGSSGAAPGSKVAATTSDTACHHPASPAMEVSSPMPGQQQQQPSKQRQRGGDLPPLPPPQLAGASGSTGAAAGPSLSTLFSSDTLRVMAETLLGVAVDTSQLWSSSTAGAQMADNEASKDVAVAREALQLLQRLLEHHPPLLQLLLLDVEDAPLLSKVLLSPYYSALRRQAAELLEKLVSIESNRPKLLPWLLMRLVGVAQPLAEQRPASCAEFYQLLCRMINKLGQGAVAEPEQLFSMAGHMLSEQVQALRAMAAAGPPQGPLSPNTKQQQQPHRRRRRKQPAVSIDDSDGAGDADDQQEPPMSVLLQGRLQLVLALVRLLDRRAVGSHGQGDLMKLLLQEFLFPEAVAKMAAAGGQLNLQRCTSSLEPHCATPNSRRAALELLAELMGDTPCSLEEGINMLLNLHYQEQVLTRHNLLPKPLRAPGQYAGLRNGGATCYMNAVFQQLFMQPGIRAGILASSEVPELDKEDSVFAQLQGLFAQLAISKATFAGPARFWAAFKDYDGTPIDVREHQDAYEFFTRLQDCIDQHLISTSQEPAIKPVMGGTFVQQIICRGHDFTSERNEDFYQISVEVKGMGTLQKSLDDYVKGELMEGDNAYLCEELGKRVPAVKRTAIRTLPQMLCVHLKRFEFDYHNQTRHKLRDRFEFPLEINMFPYTAEGLAAADAQQKLAEEQQQGQGQPRPVRTSSGASTAAAGQSAQGSHPAYMYDLHGVVVHSGSAFTGHYYSYIKERPGSSSGEQGPRWYCFDDKDVSPWDESQLEMDCYGGKASQDFDMRSSGRLQRNEYERAHSAYMLFYERRAASAPSAAGTSAIQQQQRRPLSAGAAADVDVDMAGDLALTPSAAAVGGVLASITQQQQWPPGSLSLPYNMPESLFRGVTEDNINLIWQLHVLDKHYFRFVRQLVDSRGDLGQLATRKSRRRDAAACGATVGALALSAVPSGSSDRVNSSMACDPPGTQQQQVQCLSTGSGALPMQVSPSPTPLQSAHPPPLEVPGSSSLADLQQSPGPSSRRGEDADAVAQVLMRLGVLFQFEVYLFAHDSLRSESNVWTEALRSLMGSGSSSTACMQVFLDLVVSHPNWLNTFLLEYNGPLGPSSPQAWAAEMISWTLQAASKRCAHQLQAYVASCLRQHIILGPETGNMGQAQQQQAAQQQAAERSLRQTLPPLGQSLIGVVEQLVLLIRGSVPRLSQGQMLYPSEPPTEVVKVLLSYAETSPWAAAHLLQVFNVVPDLNDHIVAAMFELTPHDEPNISDALPLYELLDELMPYAANMPQLIQEHALQQQAPPNPYLKQLPGSNSSSPGSSSSNEDGDGEAAGSGVHAILPAMAFQKLMAKNSPLLKGLVSVEVLRSCKRAAHLAMLLTWNNIAAITTLCMEGQKVLSNLLALLWLNNSPVNEVEWDQVCRSLSLIIMQPDQYMEQRVCWVFAGDWCLIGHNMPIKEQGLLVYRNPVCFVCVGVMRLLGMLVRALYDQQQSQDQGVRQRAERVAAHIGKFMVFNYQKVVSTDYQQLLVWSRQQPVIANMARLDGLRQELSWLLQQAQAVLPPEAQVQARGMALLVRQLGGQQQQLDQEGEEEEGEAGPAEGDGDQ